MTRLIPCALFLALFAMLNAGLAQISTPTDSPRRDNIGTRHPGERKQGAIPLSLPNPPTMPWQGITEVERSAGQTGQFQSISQKSGAVHHPGPVAHVKLPFDFRFFDDAITHGVDTYIHIGINGVVSVDPDAGAVFPVVAPYHLPPTSINNNPPATYQQLLMPFWGDFTAAPGPDGGIWTYYDSAADSFTVEWNVRTVGEPNPSSGRFQMILRRDFDPQSIISYFCNIQYAYDPLNSITLSVPTSTSPSFPGAVVGMKNLGQNSGPLSANYTGATMGEDNALQLLIPPVMSPNQYNVSTRLPVRGTSNTPDWYAYYPLTASPTAPASSLFHYGFPNETYLCKPVEEDFIAIARPLGDSLFPFRIKKDTPTTLRWEFRNGGRALTNIPVRANIYSDTTLLRSLGTVVASVAFGSTVIVTFPGPLDSTITGVPGAYRIVIFSQYAGDDDRSNDTVSFTLYVRAGDDVMPLRILNPEPRIQPNLKYYSSGSPIPVAGEFLNLGTTRPDRIPVLGCRIRNAAGTVVYQDSTETSTAWDSMQTRSVEFRPWTVGPAGLYQVELFTSLSSDGISENDILYEPNAVTVHRGRQLVKPYQPEYFIAALTAVELETGSAETFPNLPFKGATYADTYFTTLPVRVFFRNNGAMEATNVPARVTITDTLRHIVLYDESLTIPSIGNGYGIAIPTLPMFTPGDSGIYCVKAWITSPGDALIANDTASWCFIWDGATSSADTRPDVPEIRFSVTPNPANEAIGIRYETHGTHLLELGIYDIHGSKVRSIEGADLHRSGTITLHVDDLPPGVYVVRLLSANGAATTTAKLTIVR